MTTVEVLRAAKALIPDEDHWWRGDGGETVVDSAVCAANAIFYVNGMKMDRAYAGARDAFLRAVGRPTGIADHIYNWNDDADTTFAELHEAFDAAIANEEAKAQEFSVPEVIA